jgi:hypothetical protein
MKKTEDDLPEGEEQSWVLEQIEAGFEESGAPEAQPPEVQEMSREEIDALVDRTLDEQLARLARKQPKVDEK